MLPMIIDCETCPVRGDRCGECMVTAVAALGPLAAPPFAGRHDTHPPDFAEPLVDVELALDADDHLVVDRFVRAGLLSPEGAWEARVVADAPQRQVG